MFLRIVNAGPRSDGEFSAFGVEKKGLEHPRDRKGGQEMLIRTGKGLEDGWPRCGLCGRKLSRFNCKWHVFPGICLDCAPPGVVAHFGPPKRTANENPKLPFGFSMVRRCACGRAVDKRRRKCNACRQKGRRKTNRANVRQWRAKRRAGV